MRVCEVQTQAGAPTYKTNKLNIPIHPTHIPPPPHTHTPGLRRILSSSEEISPGEESTDILCGTHPHTFPHRGERDERETHPQARRHTTKHTHTHQGSGASDCRPHPKRYPRGRNPPTFSAAAQCPGVAADRLPLHLKRNAATTAPPHLPRQPRPRCGSG